MITPSSSSNRAPLPQSVPAAGQQAASARVQKSDRVTTESSAHLKAALASEPSIRPEMLARARALAADTAHPPAAMLKQLAKQLLSTRDPSADES